MQLSYDLICVNQKALLYSQSFVNSLSLPQKINTSLTEQSCVFPEERKVLSVFFIIYLCIAWINSHYTYYTPCIVSYPRLSVCTSTGQIMTTEYVCEIV